MIESTWPPLKAMKKVYRLFGTYTLPTAFLAAADQGEVLEAIREKNPGVRSLIALRDMRQN